MPTDTKPLEKSTLPWLRRFVWFCPFALALACLATLFAKWSWQALLITHFRPHLIVLCLLVLPIAWRRGFIARALVLFALASTSYPFAYALQARASIEATSDAPALRIATFNLRFDNADEKTLLAEIERLDADLLFLSEVEPARHDLIASLGARYPYHAFNGANPGAPGEALFSLVVFL